MNVDVPTSHHDGLIASIVVFLRDYASYAGGEGVAGAALVLLGALFEGIGLALIAPLLNILFDDNSAGGFLHHTAETLFNWFGASTVFSRLLLLMGIFAVAMIVRALVLLARDTTLAKLRIGFVEMERARVAEALAAASWGQVVRLRHARVIHVMSGDIQQIGTAAHFLTQCLTAVVVLTAQCVLALYLSLPLALLSFVLLVGTALALLPMMRRSWRLGHFLTEANQNLLHGTTQFLGGLKLAVSQNLQNGFLLEFRTSLQEQSVQQVNYLRQQTETRLTIATLSALMGAVLVLVGLSIFHVPPAMLVALLVVVVRMSGPSSQIQQGAQMLANALPAFDAVQTLKRELGGPTQKTSAIDNVPPIAGKIRFEHVTFIHPHDGDGEGRGVQDMTLAIEPGMCLGINGSSGAGKTTFADLLAGLYPPQLGLVTVGDLPLAGSLLDQWRDKISYIAQDPFLFHDTIRRNLAWASPGIGEATMWQALALAEATDFVRSLVDGLDTVVGERGTLLSGGERQRVALARGILRRPNLMILDEATNALDPATERTVIDRLMAQSPRPTMVVIAHRPESLLRCDRVITIENGHLV
jgi:ATP-binding cassette, subfamily C, bacterial